MRVACRPIPRCGPHRPRPRPSLPLGVLGRLPGLLQAVLLALLDPGVAGHEPGLLQRRAVLRVDQDQRAGDAEAQRARLAGHSAAGDWGHHVELVFRAEGHERLVDQLLMHLVREVGFQRPAVDLPLARSGRDPDPGDRLLAPAGAGREAGHHRAPGRGPRRTVLGGFCGVLRRRVRAVLVVRGAGDFRVVDVGTGCASGLSHSVPRASCYRYCSICVISYGCGCCALCGWSGPAYTLSLVSVLRPREFFGSMPRTAFSTAFSGLASIRLAYDTARKPPG